MDNNASDEVPTPVGDHTDTPAPEQTSGEPRRGPRRGRGPRRFNRGSASSTEPMTEANPYREDAGAHGVSEASEPDVRGPSPSSEAPASPSAPNVDGGGDVGGSGGGGGGGGFRREQREVRGRDSRDRDRDGRDNGRNPRRHRRNRGRTQQPRRDDRPSPQAQQPVITATGEVQGWYDPSRDGGYIRGASASYLAEAGDAWVPPQVMRQYALRKSDLVDATVGRDQRGRTTVMEVKSINGEDPAAIARRPEFNSLVASYPERKLTLETGRPAKGGNELIRRAIDLIAPIGYGQRALIVAPARAGKTTLLHAITEGIAINHPNASLIILLVDERPEEVSEAISWGVGEVVASSFDQPAERHVEVTEMVLERARRLVEMGKDVVIVLDSLTRMARAHNTVERGTGRTLSGGLDASAMAKPKAFFGSARNIPDTAGGGSLTIIATALVETGSRMDDVIFEEFKGTGNCEIKLDRSLAEKRIYPAIDIGTSGTRREEKLFRPDQLDGVYTLRRGLSQMPPQSAMEWLIKRIAGTPNNDNLLSGL